MLTKIHHVGVAVRDADAALRFYRDLLGLPVTKDAILEEQGVRGVLLAAGETEIELLEPLKPDTPVGRFLDSRGEGLHHLCFATDDIDAELAAAKAKALPLIDERARPGLAGMIAFLHPKATRGVLVEYAQPPSTSPFPPAHGEPVEPGEGGQGVRSPSPEFDHLAIAVSDLDAGVGAFVANFGLLPSPPRESTALGIRAVSLPIGGAYIGVVTPLSTKTSVETSLARFIDRRGEGLYLISLAVAKLDDAVEALRRGAQSVADPLTSESGAQLAFVSPRGTNGVLIQLIERTAA